MFGVKKRVKPVPVMTYRHILQVHFQSNLEDSTGWYFERPTDMGPSHFWRGFLKWYFTKDTPSYLIQVPFKMIGIQRSNIKFFQLMVREYKDGKLT